jgi:hypothetical protein
VLVQCKYEVAGCESVFAGVKVAVADVSIVIAECKSVFAEVKIEIASV